MFLYLCPGKRRSKKTHRWWKTLSGRLEIDACFSDLRRQTRTSDQTWNEQIDWKCRLSPFLHLSKYLGSPSETASLSASAGVKRWRPRHQNTEDIIVLVAKFYCLGLSFAKRHGHVHHWLAKRWPHQISPTFPQSPSWEKRFHISLGSPLASERQSARRHLPSLTGLVYGRAQRWKPSRTFPLLLKSTARQNESHSFMWS